MSKAISPTAGPPDAALTARRLLRSVPMASLATASEAFDGWPYASLVAVATGHDGTPVLLLSELSDHTRNLAADPRASLLLDHSDGIANRMAGERLTLMGRVRKVEGERQDILRKRYLARHPAASHYAGFGDFGLFEMVVERAHLIAGFGRAFWLEASAFVPALPSDYTLAEREDGIVAHMNEDHLDAIAVYAQALARRGGNGWRMTGIDLDGFDLRRGGETARIGFGTPVHDGDTARRVIIELVQQGRAAGSEPG